MTTKFIVRKVPERDISELITNIPGLIVVEDRTRNAMDTFIDALKEAGTSAAVHLEDDVILCDNFLEVVQKHIEENPDKVIQFFSRRKDDFKIGTRMISGGAFLSTVCFYLPEGMSEDLIYYYKTWDRLNEHPTGTDLMVADYLKLKKIRFINIVPNPVDHKEGKSAIDPRRSSKRQSYTFKK